MTDPNSTEHSASDQPSVSGQHSASGQAEGSADLEEAAKDGPLPGTEHIDEAADTGRDTPEADDPGDNATTDPIAGGGILGGISQSR